MAPHHGFDAFDRAPTRLREVFKRFQKIKPDAVDADTEILDPSRGLTDSQKQNIRVVQWRDQDALEKTSAAFTGLQAALRWQGADEIRNLAYEHKDMPGLFLIPSLLSPQVQVNLLSCILHRDLSNPMHKTNLHMHYDWPYPEHGSSFFTYSPTAAVVLQPKDPGLHKALTISRALDKKLRWITLGGQYDWTEKRYPDEQPPQFPSDITEFLRGLFPSMTPEAAIVNFYTPGDTLSLHRDISEQSDQGLASLSIGCDGIFVIGCEVPSENRDQVKSIVVRLRSGDAVYMEGPSRFAWHGVPQIVPDTCPSWLERWPALGDRGKQSYEYWDSWMRTKRLNLNVRQMWD
ncbi:MAG: hypothetical protein M1821_003820 [Bathelium mastoideum]|nr:MAG: hypothetical protein M1821_003820 [Bathelium mastoideum]